MTPTQIYAALCELEYLRSDLPVKRGERTPDANGIAATLFEAREYGKECAKLEGPITATSLARFKFNKHGK